MPDETHTACQVKCTAQLMANSGHDGKADDTRPASCINLQNRGMIVHVPCSGYCVEIHNNICSKVKAFFEFWHEIKKYLL